MLKQIAGFERNDECWCGYLGQFRLKTSDVVNSVSLPNPIHTATHEQVKSVTFGATTTNAYPYDNDDNSSLAESFASVKLQSGSTSTASSRPVSRNIEVPALPKDFFRDYVIDAGGM